MPSWFLSFSLSLTRISYISILPSQNDARVRLFTCVLLYVCTYKYIVFPRTDKFYWVGFLRTSKNLYTVHLENTQIVNAPIGTRRNTGVKIKKRLASWFNFFFFFNNRKTGFLIDWSHVFRSRATQRLVSALYRGSSARVEAGTSDVAGKLSSNICNYVYFFLT